MIIIEQRTLHLNRLYKRGQANKPMTKYGFIGYYARMSTPYSFPEWSGQNQCEGATGGNGWPAWSVSAAQTNGSKCLDCCAQMCSDIAICMDRCSTCCDIMDVETCG